MKRLDKKGFTLVELLAVIVILALIMAIAIYSISGVLTSSRQSVYKETAAGIIRGVKMQLTVANRMESGKYYFDTTMLESGGTNPPFGGTYNFGTGTAVEGTKGVYKADDQTDSCTATTTSYVLIDEATNTSKICLTAGANYRYIYGTEAEMLGSGTSMIKLDDNTTNNTNNNG